MINFNMISLVSKTEMEISGSQTLTKFWRKLVQDQTDLETGTNMQKNEENQVETKDRNAETEVSRGTWCASDFYTPNKRFLTPYFLSVVLKQC